jgi:hypothetical protein
VGQQLETVHSRHLQVCHHKGDRLPPQLLDRDQAVAGDGNEKSPVVSFQPLFQGQKNFLVIVDDQNGLSHPDFLSHFSTLTISDFAAGSLCPAR